MGDPVSLPTTVRFTSRKEQFGAWMAACGQNQVKLCAQKFLLWQELLGAR